MIHSSGDFCHTHFHITTEHFLLVDYFSRFWWLAGWAVDPRSGEVLLPFHDLPPRSRTFGPRRILPCLLDQLAPRVATKKNGTRVLPELGSTPGKWSCWRPVELLHRGWCYSSSSMRHLLPTLGGVQKKGSRIPGSRHSTGDFVIYTFPHPYRTISASRLLFKILMTCWVICWPKKWWSSTAFPWSTSPEQNF